MHNAVVLMLACAASFAAAEGSAPVGVAKEREGLLCRSRFQEVVVESDHSEILFEYKIENVGDKQRTITSLELCCGMQSLTRLPLVVPAKGDVALRFSIPVGSHTQAFGGPMTVISDDQDDPYLVLTATVLVPRLARLSPPVLVWDASGQAPYRKMNIEMVAGGTLILDSIQEDRPTMDLKLERVGDGSSYVLTAAPLNPQKGLETVVKVKTIRGDILRLPLRVVAGKGLAPVRPPGKDNVFLEK